MALDRRKDNSTRPSGVVDMIMTSFMDRSLLNSDHSFPSRTMQKYFEHFDLKMVYFGVFYILRKNDFKTFFRHRLTKRPNYQFLLKKRRFQNFRILFNYCLYSYVSISGFRPVRGVYNPRCGCVNFGGGQLCARGRVTLPDIPDKRTLSLTAY